MARSKQFEHQDPGAERPDASFVRIDPSVCTEDGRIRAGRLKGLTMWAAIWVLAWPVLLESFLNALVGFVDTLLASSISEAATDAIGVASYFNWFIGLIAIALGVGATAMIARAMGKGRVAAANAALGQTVVLALVLGAIGGGIVALAAPHIASVLNLEGEPAELATRYLRVLAFGVPGGTMMFACIACVRGAGDSVRPLVAMTAVNLVNIVVSFVLSGTDLVMARATPDGEIAQVVVLANPFSFDMGTSGIAAGTVVAFTVGALLMLSFLIRGVHGLRLLRRRLRPHWHTIRRIVRVGFPNFLETAGMWCGNFVTLWIVGLMTAEMIRDGLGESGLFGAHIVAIRIEAFSFLPGFAMGTAAATLTGQYLGAGSPRLARLAIIRCACVGASLMLLFGIAFLTIPRQIVGLFTPQPSHLEITPSLLMVCGVIQIPFAIAIVVRGALRGAGDTRATMAITWFSTYGLRIPLAWLGSGVDIPLPGGGLIVNPAPLEAVGFHVHPLTGMWIGLCSEIALRSVLFTARLLQGKWASVRV